ncbi:MAG: hypothetical protein DWQ08_07235 [Proteobacteria bacterium]|nr:MAG: hypothetical protein DWQ08_07235 [Pseudomonadota bacterium]
MRGLRRLGLVGTARAKTQNAKIRVKPFKIGARIRITARKLRRSFANTCRSADDLAWIPANLHRYLAWVPFG